MAILLAIVVISLGVSQAQVLHKHWPSGPGCLQYTWLQTVDGINLTGEIRLHGNVPDGYYKTTATAGIGGDGGALDFEWDVVSGVAMPRGSNTGFLLDVQNRATPGYVLVWYNTVRSLPAGFTGDANGFEAPTGFYVGSPVDVCDDQTGQRYPATFYWDVYGAEVPADENQTKQCSANTGCASCSSKGMATYWLHLMLASLHIEDTPISYNSPLGPSTDFKVVYNHREANQPASFAYSNFGPKWTFNWLSYVTDDGPSAPSARAIVAVRGGGIEIFSGFNPSTQSYWREKETFAVLVRTSSSSYERRFPDGSKEIFSVSDGASSYPRRVFLSSVVDPTGNAVTLGYDTTFRITSITDALGQSTTLDYTLAKDSLKITKVTDPFGRFASFEYTDGKLTKITDPIGIESRFGYGIGSDFIDSMTTPYGTATFAAGETGNATRWVELTDPAGGKERVEYQDAVAVIAPSEPVAPAGVSNTELNRRNTFYWDKKAMAEAPGDYTKARIIHWFRSSDDAGKVSGVKHSEKLPLENRVWYNYAGESGGSIGTNALATRIARVLHDGTTQASYFEYNLSGNRTKSTDPSGRVTSFVYDANQIDLLSTYQRNPAGTSTDPDGQQADLIGSYTYDPTEPPHRPQSTTDEARQTTTFHYNPAGQILWVRNAKNETTSYAYGDGSPGNPIGYVSSVTSPAVDGVSAVLRFEYDTAYRIFKQIEIDGFLRTFLYDDLDRRTKITFPDGTYQEFRYTRRDDVTFADTGIMLLDLTASRDRRSLWTMRTYDHDRRMTAMRDPENRVTTYDWCNCGTLQGIKDAAENVTTFFHDLQGRTTRKQYADGTGIEYSYEGQTGPNTAGATSRLASMTDAKGQRTNYRYRVDDNVGEISYTDSSGAPLVPVTPTVSYAYDASYDRLQSMDDGTGHSEYTYHPVTVTGTLGANRLKDVDGPLTNDVISYSYDQLGRSTGQSINGVAATMDYDALGRIYSNTNDVLGGFSRTYDGVTARLASVTAAQNGQTSTFHYLGSNDDRRLQFMESHRAGGENLSRFDYTYDQESEIKTWSKLLGTTASTLWFDYDDAQQLRSAHNAQQLTFSTYAFDSGYDLAGNRLSDQVYNPSLDIGGGTLHEYTTSNVNQLKTRTTKVNGIPSAPVALQYDANGNMTYDAAGKTYEWDAANRLVAINYLETGARSEFAYDGMNRRVQIVEKETGLTKIVQPTGINYAKFSSLPFTATDGNYTIAFEALNSRAVALIDDVSLNGVLVANGNFEKPLADASAVQKATATSWTLAGDAGITRNGSDLTRNPKAPTGTRMGFLKNNTGVIRQTIALATGNYTLTFKGAQGARNEKPQQVRATIENAGQTGNVRRFVWNGNVIAEERDSTGATVKKRFFAEGEQRRNEKTLEMEAFYYTRDHLGSIREVTDASGTLTARYDYDVWGNAEEITGKMNIDFGYTGHYFHAPSGLNLTLYRAYSPAMGRWLSRDPLRDAETKEGANLYSYVGSAPINAFDPLGLAAVYGNWCGPNWTGGRRESFFRHRPGFYVPPIDGLDAACAKHDICYYKCRRAYPCDPERRKQCFRNCDYQLTDAAYSHGGLSANFIGAVIDRPGQRDPEENDPSCSCEKK